MRKIKNIEMALALFMEAADAHGKSIEIGDYKVTNKSYKILDKAFEFLRDNDKLMELKPLLSHPSVGVRSWTSLYLLPILEQDAIKAIEDIIEDQTVDWLNRFESEQVLKRWYNGDLQTWLIPKVLGTTPDEIK